MRHLNKKGFGGGGGSAGGFWYSGGGGGLGYKNNIAVTPLTGYTVVVGAGGQAGGANIAGCGGSGASGAVRIVWPGVSRQFPATDVSTFSGETIY